MIRRVFLALAMASGLAFGAAAHTFGQHERLVDLDALVRGEHLQ